MKIDIDQLRDLLSGNTSQCVLREFLENCSSLERRGADHSRTKVSSWRDLQMESDVSHLLHPSTIARLEADAYEEKPIDATQAFAMLSDAKSTIQKSLPVLRKIATPYYESYRTHQVVAEAGYTKLIFVFPHPEHIQTTLGALEQFRNEAPLGHPVWNALFLETMILQLHPFQDGNGRTIRAFTDYELWRSNLSGATIINANKVLDANRATQLKHLTRIHQSAKMPDACTNAIHEYLNFLVELRTVHRNYVLKSSI